MALTNRSTVVAASRSSRGYWRLRPGAGEAHRTRLELVGARSIGNGRDAPGEALLTIGQLSDLHVCDTQSPARGEFLDRWADDDSPVKASVQAVGTYRAQDCLTVQVAEAAVQAMNAVPGGPIGGASLDWTVVTGDVTDNSQANEVGWYLRLLEGGPIVPDSGDPERYEGVARPENRDAAYWHPSSGSDDRPHRLGGFPDAPGLLDALRMPFDATGLAMPWLAVHGNHDQLVLGSMPAATVAGSTLSGTAERKAYGLPEHWSHDAIARFCHDAGAGTSDAVRLWDSLPSQPITPDPSREPVTRRQFIAAHFGTSARPPGHGFEPHTVDSGRAYYRHDHGQVTVLVLDTVNENGGWQGSLDRPQLAWLDEELAAADRERRYVLLASHHRLADLTNPRASASNGQAEHRVLAAELDAMLARHRSVVLWINGHAHRCVVSAHRNIEAVGSEWWEVTSPSMIDYPQQGRVIELMRSPDRTLTIATTMLDHAGELPWSGEVQTPLAMAGLSRELAANAWQWRTDDLARHGMAGTPEDRNVLLLLPDPFG